MEHLKKPSVWHQFVSIAQPYFFPRIRAGGWITLLLMVMLLIFLFGVLCIVIAGAVWAGSVLAPDLTQKLAGGLLGLIQGSGPSKIWILAVALLLPVAIFSIFSKHLKIRKKAWIFLGVVLLLSLSVTGINVAFSYIGNYFTNAPG